jgi:hypothetical protein
MTQLEKYEPHALTLPQEHELRGELAAVARFQQMVRVQLKDGHDYGVIPGTGNKPTLLKPGAEKITKLLGLADSYEFVDRVEDWNRPLFRYLIRCTLTSVRNGIVIAEGLGECNSMESKYRYRWVWPDDLPEGFDKESAVSRRVRNGGKQYRLESDDVYSQVNTILKMAKKRAHVDAALSAGRLSDVFTQDVEDLAANGVLGSEVTEGANDEVQGDAVLCPVHGEPFFQKGKMRSPGHQLPDKSWCNFKPQLFGAAVEQAAKAAGWDSGQVNEYCKAEYGKTWSQLTMEECIGTVAFVHGLSELTAEHEATLDAQEDAAAEPTSGAPDSPDAQQLEEFKP